MNLMIILCVKTTVKFIWVVFSLGLDIIGPEGETGVKGQKGDGGDPNSQPGSPGTVGLKGFQGPLGKATHLGINKATIKCVCVYVLLLLDLSFLHLGDHGRPGVPGTRGPVGPDGTPDKPGQSGEPGFPGPPGFRGDHCHRKHIEGLLFKCILCIYTINNWFLRIPWSQRIFRS